MGFSQECRTGEFCSETSYIGDTFYAGHQGGGLAGQESLLQGKAPELRLSLPNLNCPIEVLMNVSAIPDLGDDVKGDISVNALRRRKVRQFDVCLQNWKLAMRFSDHDRQEKRVDRVPHYDGLTFDIFWHTQNS